MGDIFGLVDKISNGILKARKEQQRETVLQKQKEKELVVLFG